MPAGSERSLPQPSTLNPQPSTLNPQPPTLNPQPSTLNPQPSTLNPQPSTLNPQNSTLNTQPHTAGELLNRTFVFFFITLKSRVESLSLKYEPASEPLHISAK